MADKQILLVEPDILLLAQYSHKLRQEFTVFDVTLGQQAIDILDSKKNIVDLIILDLNLGKNNGIETLHEIRSYDDWIEIPIIILSSVPVDRVPVAKLQKYGINTILYKPQTRPAKLLLEVRKGLHRVPETSN